MKDLKTMKVVFAVTVIALTFFLLPTRGYAIIMYSDRPSWEAAVIAEGLAVEDVDLASQVAEFAPLPAGTSLLLPSSETLFFDTDLTGLQVPTSWATWSGGQTPRVLFTPGGGPVTGFFGPGPVGAFGLEMEPNQFATFDMTLLTSDGGILTQPVAGEAGAAFFGWTDGSVIAMVAACPDCGTADIPGFAMGRLVKGEPVPEPASLLLLGSALAGLGLWGRKKFKTAG